jgi:hypothetical protein
MKTWIPVLLSFVLGPGVGQLYNRQFKKGVYLIALSLVVLAGWGLWIYKAMQPLLPPNLAAADPAAVEQFVKNATAQVSASHGGTLWVYQGILLVLWLYSILDAYWVAQQRRRKS